MNIIRKLKSIVWAVLLTFGVSTGGHWPSSASAQNLPIPALSPAFSPVTMKGIKVFPDNPFRFEFIVDQGNSALDTQAFKAESTKLIKYFLASLTVPEKDLWVNLSPYEKDRIIPEGFGQTEMGRDLLTEDYFLKQITSSLMNPEGELGKKFWEKVYAQAGTTDIPDMFNPPPPSGGEASPNLGWAGKVWIVPEKAVVYENKNVAFVVEAKLRVMLENDIPPPSRSEWGRLGGGEATVSPLPDPPHKGEGNSPTDIIRQIILPALEKEVNEGKNFANLRQIYYSLILATWFKRNLKKSILGKKYVNQNKVEGVNVDDPKIKEKIYEKYLEAFKKGAYDSIKDEYDPKTQQIIPRKYFSGGAGFNLINSAIVMTHDAAMIQTIPAENLVQIESAIKNVSAEKHNDAAMLPPAGQGAALQIPQAQIIKESEANILNRPVQSDRVKKLDAKRRILEFFKENPDTPYSSEKIGRLLPFDVTNTMIRGYLRELAVSGDIQETGKQQGGITVYSYKLAPNGPTALPDEFQVLDLSDSERRYLLLDPQKSEIVSILLEFEESHPKDFLTLEGMVNILSKRGFSRTRARTIFNGHIRFLIDNKLVEKGQEREGDRRFGFRIAPKAYRPDAFKESGGDRASLSETIKTHVKAGQEFLDQKQFDQAKEEFSKAAKVYVDFERKVEPDRRDFDNFYIQSWIRATSTENIFTGLSASGGSLKRLRVSSYEEAAGVLTSSLLLANDYFRRKGPDISHIPGHVHGTVENIEEVIGENGENLKIGQRLQASGIWGPTSSETYEFKHKVTGEHYIVKFMGLRNLTEVLGQRWFAHLGFSTVETHIVIISGRPAVIMKKLDHVETLYKYIFNQLIDPRVFRDEIIEERLFPDSFRSYFESSKIADVVIELKDAHLNNILLKVNREGELLPEPPIFIDKERSFGFRTNPQSGEGVIYQPYRGSFQRTVLETGKETRTIDGGEPTFHRGLPVGRLREMALKVAQVQKADIERIVDGVLAEASPDEKINSDFSREIFVSKWLAAIESVRTIFNIDSDAAMVSPPASIPDILQSIQTLRTQFDEGLTAEPRRSLKINLTELARMNGYSLKELRRLMRDNPGIQTAWRQLLAYVDEQIIDAVKNRRVEGRMTNLAIAGYLGLDLRTVEYRWMLNRNIIKAFKEEKRTRPKLPPALKPARKVFTASEPLKKTAPAEVRGGVSARQEKTADNVRKILAAIERLKNSGERIIERTIAKEAGMTYHSLTYLIEVRRHPEIRSAIQELWKYIDNERILPAARALKARGIEPTLENVPGESGVHPETVYDRWKLNSEIRNQILSKLDLELLEGMAQMKDQGINPKNEAEIARRLRKHNGILNTRRHKNSRVEAAVSELLAAQPAAKFSQPDQARQQSPIVGEEASAGKISDRAMMAQEEQRGRGISEAIFGVEKALRDLEDSNSRPHWADFIQAVFQANAALAFQQGTPDFLKIREQINTAFFKHFGILALTEFEFEENVIFDSQRGMFEWRGIPLIRKGPKGMRTHFNAGEATASLLARILRQRFGINHRESGEKFVPPPAEIIRLKKSARQAVEWLRTKKGREDFIDQLNDIVTQETVQHANLVSPKVFIQRLGDRLNSFLFERFGIKALDSKEDYPVLYESGRFVWLGVSLGIKPLVSIKYLKSDLPQGAKAFSEALADHLEERFGLKADEAMMGHPVKSAINKYAFKNWGRYEFEILKSQLEDAWRKELTPAYSKDKDFIIEVLDHLLVNAFEALWMRTQAEENFIPSLHFKLSLTPQGRLKLVVEDNGVGMTKDVAAQFMTYRTFTTKDGIKNVRTPASPIWGGYGIGAPEMHRLLKSLKQAQVLIETKAKDEKSWRKILKLPQDQDVPEIIPGERTETGTRIEIEFEPHADWSKPTEEIVIYQSSWPLETPEIKPHPALNKEKYEFWIEDQAIDFESRLKDYLGHKLRGLFLIDADVFDNFCGRLLVNAFDALWQRAQEEEEYHPLVDFQVSLTREGNFRILIEDNGIGMTKETMERFLTKQKGISTKRKIRDVLTGDSPIFGGQGDASRTLYMFMKEKPIKVVVETKRKDEQSWRKVLEFPQEESQMTPGNRAEPGTRIEVEFEPSADWPKPQKDVVIYQNSWPQADVSSPREKSDRRSSDPRSEDAAMTGQVKPPLLSIKELEKREILMATVKLWDQTDGNEINIQKIRRELGISKVSYYRKLFKWEWVRSSSIFRWAVDTLRQDYKLDESATEAWSVSSLEDIKRKAVDEALWRNHGNVKKTSEELGIGKSTLHRLIADYEMDLSSYRIGRPQNKREAQKLRKGPVTKRSQATQEEIRNALNETDGRIAATARLLKMKIKTLWRKIHKFEIDLNPFRQQVKELKIALRANRTIKATAETLGLTTTELVEKMIDFGIRGWPISDDEIILIPDKTIAEIKKQTSDLGVRAVAFEEAEMAYLKQKLQENRGNVSQVARKLGTNDSLLTIRVKRYQIDLKEFSPLRRARAERLFEATEVKEETTDEAMTAAPVVRPPAVRPTGGIDFNPQKFNLETEGNGVEFNVPDPAQLQNMEINGLTPVIFTITPVKNLPLWLGISEKKKEQPSVS